MSREYWKEYYQQNKKKILLKKKIWVSNNPEKVKKYKELSRQRHIEKYRAKARLIYKEWISIEENRIHKKEYQKQWWKNKSEWLKEEAKEFKQIEKALKKGKAGINGYDVEIKQDKGGMWFYYLSQDGLLVYISDKFETKKSLLKDLQDAI